MTWNTHGKIGNTSVLIICPTALVVVNKQNMLKIRKVPLFFKVFDAMAEIFPRGNPLLAALSDERDGDANTVA